MTSQTLTGQRDRYAAIDLGTNTCLLLIAQWDGSQLVPLADELRVVRLGAGIDHTGMLSDEAMARAELAFREYQAIIKLHQCHQVRCIATSAFREAINRDQLRQRLLDATGFNLVEVSGWQEAELVLKAVQHDFPRTSGNRIVVDVGGGSTEITLEKNGSIDTIESLPLGSVRLTERWLRHDPPSLEDLSALTRDIDSVLAGIRSSRPVEALVGVGGTATTFVAMDLQLESYDHDRVHGATLTGSTLHQILKRCTAMPLNERLKLPGLHPGRADVIIAGGQILKAVMDCFGRDKVTVSDRGVLWGMIYDMVVPGAGAIK